MFSQKGDIYQQSMQKMLLSLLYTLIKDKNEKVPILQEDKV